MTTTLAPAESILATVHRLSGRGDRTTKTAALQGILADLPKSTVDVAKRNLTDAIEKRAAGGKVDLQATAHAVLKAQQDELATALIREYIGNEIFTQRDYINTRRLTPDAQAAIVSYLSNELARVVDVAREADATLGDVSNATEAIRAGLSDTWTALDDAVHDYTAIRTGQAEMYAESIASGNVNYGVWMRTAGLLADAIDHEGFWTVRRRHNARQSPADHASEKAWLTWLTDLPALDVWPTTHEGHWPTTDRHAYLRWIATNATPWVPSITTLEAAYVAAITATSSTLGDGNTTALEQARDTYRQITTTS